MLILGKLNPEYYCEGLTGKPINILFFSYICEKLLKISNKFSYDQ
jgi:hypothetical protein